MKKLTLIMGVLTLVVVGCGPIEGEPAEPGAEQLGTDTAALTTYPECCSAIPGSGYTESFCDSVAYSPGRCNQVWGGTACQWNNANCPVTCCQPKSGSAVSWNYCNTYAISAARCNAVDGGSSCNWTC